MVKRAKHPNWSQFRGYLVMGVYSGLDGKSAFVTLSKLQRGEAKKFLTQKSRELKEREAEGKFVICTHLRKRLARAGKLDARWGKPIDRKPRK